MAAVLLLAGTVVVMALGHRRARASVVVLVAVLAGTALGVLDVHTSADAVRDLAAPVAFLVAAVPLATLLAHVGFFDEVASRLPSGPRLLAGLWAFAALVTTVCNLDASIVLLTPIYLRVARRSGLDPLVTAAIPVLLASLASSALPVSNLTNLIVADRLDLGAIDFVRHLGPMSLVATVVGWVGYRRVVRATAAPANPRTGFEAAEPHPLALRVGGPAVAVLLFGFTAGDAIGVPAWAVAAGVAVALAAVTRRVPWRAVPVDAIVVACGLAALAAAASPHLGLARALRDGGAGADVRVAAVGVVGAVVTNNLPALLVALPVVAPARVWALLLGVNLGPVLWVSGSLAGLLWMDLVRQGGVTVTPGWYARLGVRVGLPALVAALATLVIGGRLG